MDRLLSLDEIAEVLNCHPRTITRNLKKIPHSKVGSLLRFDAAKVLSALEADKPKPNKDKVRRASIQAESEFAGVLNS